MDLIYTETGRIAPTACEEIAGYRRIRKVLVARSEPEGEATLYLHVRRYVDHRSPLSIRVNNTTFTYPVAPYQEYLHWAAIQLPQGIVRQGINTIELSTEGAALTGWTISLEGGHSEPGSYLSTDGGRSWQNHRMGIYHIQRGEYLIRLRIETDRINTNPPPFTWEDRRYPRLSEVQALIPEEIKSIQNAWKRARTLATWVSTQWEYLNAADKATFYTPWDPFTILAWRPGTRIHGQDGAPIRMCVHYGVVFICACLACGIPARGIIASSEVRHLRGHFVCEVWNPQFRQWSLVDPNLDVTVVDGERPLSALEVFGHGAQLRELVQMGPGAAKHRARLGAYLDEYQREAAMLRLTGVWPRNDFLSHPECAPACHGQETYSETEIVWSNRNRSEGELEMFPVIAGDGWFSQPPPASWLEA